MNVKPSFARRGLQAAVILFAIGMAGAFVVYSQRKADRAMIRGTKSTQVLEDLRVEDSAQDVWPQTWTRDRERQISPADEERLLISGSKSSVVFKVDTPPHVSDLWDFTPLPELPIKSERGRDSFIPSTKSFLFDVESGLSLSLEKPRATPTLAADDQVKPETSLLNAQPILVGSSKSTLMFTPERAASPEANHNGPASQPLAPQKARPIPVLISSSKSSLIGASSIHGGELAPDETVGQRIGTVVIPGIKPPPTADIFVFTNVAPKTPSLTDLIPDLQNIEQLKNAPRDPLFVGRKLTIVHTGSDADFVEDILRGLKSPDERFLAPLGGSSTAFAPTLLVPMPRLPTFLPSNFIGVSAPIATARSKANGVKSVAPNRAAKRAMVRSALISTSKSGAIFVSGTPYTLDELLIFEEPIRVGPLSVEPSEPAEVPARFRMLGPNENVVIPDLTTRIPGLYEFARPVRAMP